MCQLIFSAIPQHLLLLLFYCCINELHNITSEKTGSKPRMSKWQVILFSGGKWMVNG